MPKSYQLLPTLYPHSSKILYFLIQTPLQETHIAGEERREQTESFNENRLQGQPDYELLIFWCLEKHPHSRKKLNA